MDKEIHIYNNGVKCYKASIFEQALQRYKLLNIHEPLEESVFNHIFCSDDIKTFFDVGSAWGYYSLLARKYSTKVKVYAFDGQEKACQDCRANIELNQTSGITVFQRCISFEDLPLNEALISTNGIVDLIKIDIQGEAVKALESAGEEIASFRNVLVGTHEYGGKTEHQDCLHLLKKNNFKIKINLRPADTPLQPDGIIWGQSPLCK